MFDKLREVTDTPNYHSICIVLSPLKALMQDQVTKFTARGLTAAFVGGGQEERAIYDSVINGDMQLASVFQYRITPYNYDYYYMDTIYNIIFSSNLIGQPESW